MTNEQTDRQTDLCIELRYPQLNMQLLIHDLFGEIFEQCSYSKAWATIIVIVKREVYIHIREILYRCMMGLLHFSIVKMNTTAECFLCLRMKRFFCVSEFNLAVRIPAKQGAEPT